jgi:hypothetical protein
MLLREKEGARPTKVSCLESFNDMNHFQLSLMIKIARPYRTVRSGGFSSVNSSTEAKSGRRQWLYIIGGVLFFVDFILSLSKDFFCTSKRK